VVSPDRQIEVIFSGFRRANVNIGFPSAGVLSAILNREADMARRANMDSFPANQPMIRLFASAAVEMWQRALHSFIVSAGLTITSPIWSSAAGYYASHYVVRGYAHLLGRYLLYTQKRVVSLLLRDGGFVCTLDKKGGGDREHKAYWKFVRASDPFGKDPFFNVDTEVVPRSDSAHRTKANYADHVGEFRAFKALTLEAAVDRIKRIAEIEIAAVPIPSADSYPDLESVQIVAYHRIVHFRRYLDNLLGGENRFWNAHRTPQWCDNVVDFQIADTQFLPMSANP
jgi:hypothetical protein